MVHVISVKEKFCLKTFEKLPGYSLKTSVSCLGRKEREDALCCLISVKGFAESHFVGILEPVSGPGKVA